MVCEAAVHAAGAVAVMLTERVAVAPPAPVAVNVQLVEPAEDITTEADPDTDTACCAIGFAPEQPRAMDDAAVALQLRLTDWPVTTLDGVAVNDPIDGNSTHVSLENVNVPLLQLALMLPV